MIIDFHKYYGGGSGSEMTPEQVQEQINSALTPYWDSATTKSAIAEAISSIPLEGYATSDDMQSAFTLISETQQAAEAGYNQLEARIDELSGSSPDLSAYYTSAQTENAIEEAIAGYSPDLSAYYTSAQTENAIQEALSGYSPDLSAYYTSAQTENAIQEAIAGVSVDLSGYYTSAQTQDAIGEAMTAYTPTTGFSTINGSAITDGGDIVIQGGGGGSTEEIELPIAAAVNDLKGNIEARLNQKYYTRQEVNDIAARKTEPGQVDIQIKNYVDPAIAEVNETIVDKELPVSAALNDLNTNKVSGVGITKIQSISQADYDTLTVKDPATLYIIKD